MWGAQRETLGLEAGAGGGGGRCSCPAPAECPAPRNESRSAVRIKVLDVLSFVLLINRQFYEVRVGAAAGALGRQGRGDLRGPCRALLASEAACGPCWGPSVAGFVSSLTSPSLRHSQACG